MIPDYPTTRRSDQVDDYHGTRVADPYRWLEQPAQVPEVADWIGEQNRLSRSWLDSMPERDELKRRLTELWDYPKHGAPFRRGDRYFQFRNAGLQNQNVLFVMAGPREEGRMLLDPNALSADGRTALTFVSPSPDGSILAYAVSEGGSDWNEWRFIDVESGEPLPDRLRWVKFSGAEWHPDGSGVFYQTFPAPAGAESLTGANDSPKLVFHRLGTPQRDDELVYERPDQPEWMFAARVSDDDRYLVIEISRSTEPRNLVLYRPLAGGDLVPLVGEFRNEARFLGNDGDRFYLQTDRGEGRGKIVAVDLASPDAWLDVVPEREQTLEFATLVGDQFLLAYLEDASHRLRRRDVDGRELPEIELPGLGSILGLNGRREHDEGFLLFSSFLEPSTPYRIRLTAGTVERLADAGNGFDASAYRVVREFATSSDGTRVPMFVIARRDLQLDGENPTLLYGYGGFNVSQTPAYSVGRLPFLERGGVVAVANLRGGGEYGREWHEAGILDRKTNVFDDFIACAERLMAAGYTSERRLAIQGGSNGGLLVGACLTRRPDLFRAANIQVGVLDMLRYHLFTIGSRWASDYGRSDDPEQFRFLHAYSPLHNLKPGTCYPATLITTGDHDDRVVPAHSFKFTAALQSVQACERPILLRVETRTGHGLGKPTEAIIAEQSDILAFLLEELGVARSAGGGPRGPGRSGTADAPEREVAGAGEGAARRVAEAASAGSAPSAPGRG